MSTIDLAAAYHRVAQILERNGWKDGAYAIKVNVWNHRHPAGLAEVSYAIFVSKVDAHTGDRPSLDDAISIIARALDERARHQAPENLPNLVVP